ncbi:MAG: cytochrome ubiquinol oxidase subunit I [Fervidicoccaceae archaeon]
MPSLTENIGFMALGLSVIIHVAFVSVTLGVGVLTAWYRYVAYKRRSEEMEARARRLLGLLAASELMSGVWGTVITVFLAGLFPGLTALATNVLFLPISIAIIGIFIRIPSIAAFWYLWGRVDPRKHVALGFVMATSGFLIPLGFRTIFAETMSPHAIATYLASGSAPIAQAYTNPLLWVLYVHTVVAVLSVGGYMAYTVLGIHRDNQGAAGALRVGLYLLVAQLLFGPLYWLTLRAHSSYVYQNVTFGLTSPLFYLKLATIAVLLYTSVKALRALRTGRIIYTKHLGFTALFVAILGEFINDASRYPYMVVTGKEGLPISMFFNYYLDMMQALPILSVILFMILLGLGIGTFAIYLGVARKMIDYVS